MTIHPGEIYWLQLDAADGEEARIPHPHVVVEIIGDRLTVCALTSNLRRVSLPGNVLLDAGEANLPRASVVEVTKIVTVEPSQLGASVGRLAEARLQQIWAGMRFVRTSFLPPDA